MDIHVTFYEHFKNAVPVSSQSLDWDDFVAELKADGHAQLKDKKTAPLLSFVKLSAPRRAKENVASVHGWALDLDQCDDDQIASVLGRLADAGLAYVAHTTHGSTAKKLKLRILGPLAQPVAGKDWPQTWRAIIDRFAKGLSDEQCKDSSRGYAVPSHPPGGEGAIWSEPGVALDVRTLDIAEPPPKIDLNAPECFVEAGFRIDRCPRSSNPFAHAEALCRTMPPSVDGAGGSNALLRLARAVRWGLRIGASETAGLIRELYNPRCSPAWSDAEIAHKIDSVETESGAPYPQGALLPPPPDSFEHLPLIVQRQGVYWMRSSDSEDYSRKCYESDLLVNIRKQFSEELTSTWAEEGKPLTKPAIEKNSAPVSSVQSCYFESASIYDEAHEVLREGLRIDPTLHARHDADVDAWLHVLAGPQIESLRQWIAGTRSDYLRAPSRALALIGPKDTGKSLIAYGLARIWNRGAVGAGALCSRFNGALTSCPVVLADERIPAELNGEQFREVLARRSHEIEPKGKERQVLLGSVRLVIAVNDSSKLMLPGAKGANDVEAIADRLFILQIPDGQTKHAIDSLRPLKDPKDPSGSGIDLVRLAEHFLWLQTNVEPARGRFIGAPESPETELLLLTAEADRSPDLMDVFREYFANPDAWERNYKLTNTRPVAKRGEVCPEGKINFPIVQRHGMLFVRNAVLAQLIGRDAIDVARACKPFRLGARDTTIAVEGGIVTAWKLDMKKLKEAAGVFNVATG